MYCVLKKLQLQCYDAEAEHFSQPEITIPITKVLDASIIVNNMSKFKTDHIGCFYICCSLMLYMYIFRKLKYVKQTQHPVKK